MTKLTGYLKKEIVIAVMNKNCTRKETKQFKVSKKCMMCGEPTTNPSGFCNKYLESIFDCKKMWLKEYKTLPTKKELNAKWRII